MLGIQQMDFLEPLNLEIDMLFTHSVNQVSCRFQYCRMASGTPTITRRNFACRRKSIGRLDFR